MDLLAEFRTFLLVDEAAATVTADDYVRRLVHAAGQGVDLQRFHEDAAAARAQGRLFLTKLRARKLGSGGYNGHVKAMNAFARFAGHELAFKPMKPARVQPKALRPQDLEVAFRFKGQTRQNTLRAQALLQFAFTVGARVSEVSKVDIRDLNPTQSTVYIRFPAKGGLRRTLPVPRELWDPTRPFARWLKYRPIVGEDPGAIWTTDQRGGGTGVARRMKPIQLTRIMGAISKATGVRVNFVVARHTVATKMRRAGADILYIKFYLGHAKIQSSSIYIDYTQDDAQAEFDGLQLDNLLPKRPRDEESP